MALLALVTLAVACGRNQAEGDPTGSGATDYAHEQATFDAERHPEKLVEALGIHAGSKVADIGAGTGLLTIHLARAVAPSGKVVATDIEKSVLDLLAQRLDRAGLGNVVERRVVAAETPGLEPASYDAILLAEVDHLLVDPPVWLRAASTALVPGGRIVISNRIYHKAQSMTVAKKAGLELVSESTPVPTHFIAVFVVGGKK